MGFRRHCASARRRFMHGKKKTVASVRTAIVSRLRGYSMNFFAVLKQLILRRASSRAGGGYARPHRARHHHGRTAARRPGLAGGAAAVCRGGGARAGRSGVPRAADGQSRRLRRQDEAVAPGREDRSRSMPPRGGRTDNVADWGRLRCASPPIRASSNIRSLIVTRARDRDFLRGDGMQPATSTVRDRAAAGNRQLLRWNASRICWPMRPRGCSRSRWRGRFRCVLLMGAREWTKPLHPQPILLILSCRRKVAATRRIEMAYRRTGTSHPCDAAKPRRRTARFGRRPPGSTPDD